MTEVQDILRGKIDAQRVRLERWRKPSEPLLFETSRALDYTFCEELFFSEDSRLRAETPQYYLRSWGVNGALERIFPTNLEARPFKLFPSDKKTQIHVDEFVLQCGILDRAELLYGWLTEGLVKARVDRLREKTPAGFETVIVLEPDDPIMFGEIVSRKHLRWVSEVVMEGDRVWEEQVRERFKELKPQLEKCVGVHHGWGIAYSTTPEIDEYFIECGQIYLRRMWSQDLIGLEDRIGGYQFNEYLGVLAALAGRAQKHLCFATLLKDREPHLDYRNLLTTFAPHEEFTTLLARFLDADTPTIRDLLVCLTLDPSNRIAHTNSSDTAWAPLIRSSVDFCILPLYGLEMNPFLFLLKDLRQRYSDDWFQAANNREGRWQKDLHTIFSDGRWATTKKNLRLRDDGETLTDIDFIAYDIQNNQLGLFQLKWQQPVGVDNRARRSAGKNLIVQGNEWIESVKTWLTKYGTDELSRRAGIDCRAHPEPVLFVIARYNALYPGFSDQDCRATWADWAHLMKVRVENPHASIREMANALQAQSREIIAGYLGESYFLPLDETIVAVNPTSQPG